MKHEIDSDPAGQGCLVSTRHYGVMVSEKLRLFDDFSCISSFPSRIHKSHIAHPGFAPLILVPVCPECWGYSHGPPHLVYAVPGKEPRALHMVGDHSSK